ncbi:MAG: dipeptidyl aminopeptidase/acylaminoacyl peptidase [Anaerolineales bacterium]|nr:dipeptidyl aminopeptidase/acylaminoacyl peptidase [Anaerolineales bacterium]
MSEPKIAPYGSWKSPITSDLIVAETIGLGGTAIEGDDVYWMELRPKEGGRLVVVRRRRTPESKTTDLTPMPFNARTRVHEYGGRAYAVADGAAYFSNFADQRLYRQDPGAEPRPITPEIALRYADYVVDRRRNLLFCVREDHTAPGEAVNTLVTVNCDGDESGGQVIVSGNNFYASPRLSPDGSRLAWLTWNHPNMPWDGTELWAGEVNADGSLGHAERVAGGPAESVFQPEWSPDGVLYFVSDRTGWWNLYRWQKGNIEPLCPMEAEFGEPQWNFGMSTYAFESPGRIICTYTQKGTYHLASLDTATLKLEEIPTPYTDMGSVRAAPGRVLFLAGSPTEPWSIVHLDLRTRQFEVLRRTSAIKVNPGYVSTPEEIEFPTEGGLTAHAFFYAPRNRDFTAPAGEKPPLIVMSHGGPTAAVSGVFNPNIQYWTSRGFAVMDVNYGGSTGYGRAYRQRLNGQWGVVDVHDCANGAHYLAAQDRVDGERLIIRGGSAGGYTTLAALTFQNIFKAGASHFGISDLETMTKDTHKFESRYLDTLVAPYPARRDVYVERSPIHFTHRLSSAMILFQGLEDKIVPPDQSEKMFEAVRAKELPVAYLAFEGEQHGFRKAENIKRTLDAELYFYSKVFKFDLADPVEPVEIENL